jgi:hypothetical protein
MTPPEREMTMPLVPRLNIPPVGGSMVGGVPSACLRATSAKVSVSEAVRTKATIRPPTSANVSVSVTPRGRMTTLAAVSDIPSASAAVLMRAAVRVDCSL